MRTLFFSLIAIFLFSGVFAENDKIQKFQLDNGLTVILYENHSQPTVFGSVAVRAGSKDDPKDATGLAHYMEHVMFKGTQELGTWNWEAEQPHYEKIIELYEQLRTTEDETQKAELNKQINEESLKAGKYAIPNEFSNLVQAMGGTGLNAGTGYDYTFYHNSFPPFQIQRWLDLYAHRFENPVFRGFQSELETVYEEKNMYSDNPYRAVNNDFIKNMFAEGNPYGRLILGTTEHLKSPSIKRINEFYDAFYVPSNMALILAGDINPDELKPMIEATFGKWENRAAQGKSIIPENVAISKPVRIKEKLTPYPMLLVGFQGVDVSHEDRYSVDFCARLLSNSNQTGLLDRLVLDGDLINVSASHQQYKHAGLVAIQAIPTFDLSQMKFMSLSVVEKLIDAEIAKLKKGEFDAWLIDAFKDELIKQHEMSRETPMNVGLQLMNTFVYELPLEDFTAYKEQIMAVTKEDVIRAANKYFTKNRVTYLSDIGEPEKDALKKPEYKPIDPEPGHQSAYTNHFKTIELSDIKENFVDFDKEVTKSELAPGVKLYLTPNKQNDIFSLVIKYGVGSAKIPTLDLATSLMNNAGIMAQYKPQELKKEYSKLGCSVRFFNNDSYLYIILEGNEANLGQACQLLSRTYLLPELDEKQMNNVIGSEIGMRRIEEKDKDMQANALRDYMIYGEESPELNRLSTAEIRSLSISDLTGDFILATHYEASVHYVGRMEHKQLLETLRGNLAFPADLKKSASPYVRSVVKENTESILFLNNPDARQSEIYLFVNGSDYQLNKQPQINAFNQYFSGGFNGLVIQELREKRSFAYSAGATYLTPPLPGNPGYHLGYIGTQADKTADAVEEFVKLIKEMPEKPERIINIKNYLVQSSKANRPNFRNLSQSIESWSQRGYAEDPNKLLLPKYEKLTFEDILAFYKKEIAEKPIKIAIVGNKKEIDMEKLESIARIEKINVNKLFKDENAVTLPRFNE
ncbi:insulinase family protein [uncultured Draconibacterium sp.]|uniref:M16 family metallopeptidase n=1 Tax=uncultured Draconibacterium sp. TaxID=1573823 RepID=UPI00325FF43D